MRKTDLQGVLPPITTPFDHHGNVDFDGLVDNLERYNPTGLKGYVAFGSNGEAVHLSAEERRRVLRTIREQGAADHTLVAGINELSTKAAIDSIQQAADMGADVALVITPYFYKGSMTQEVLRTFFEEVAAASPLPVLAYNVPQNTGVTIAPATLGMLADCENIVGVKDSSGNLAALSETVRRVPDDFVVLVGNAGIFYPALLMGASGAILAVACTAPKACVALYRAAQEGDGDHALELQKRLAPLGTLVTADLGIAGLKASLDLGGFVGGLPRRPLLPLALEEKQRLQLGMAESGFFPALNEE